MNAPRDELLRRCTWCGDWCYGRSPCQTCHQGFTLPAVRDETRQRAVVAQRQREVRAA